MFVVVFAFVGVHMPMVVVVVMMVMLVIVITIGRIYVNMSGFMADFGRMLVRMSGLVMMMLMLVLCLIAPVEKGENGVARADRHHGKPTKINKPNKATADIQQNYIV